MAAFMSGEVRFSRPDLWTGGMLTSMQMRDTVELNPAGVYLLEKLFSKQERAKLFRSWAGAASMLLKGGNAVWGESDLQIHMTDRLSPINR